MDLNQLCKNILSLAQIVNFEVVFMIDEVSFGTTSIKIYKFAKKAQFYGWYTVFHKFGEIINMVSIKNKSYFEKIFGIFYRCKNARQI